LLGLVAVRVQDSVEPVDHELNLKVEHLIFYLILDLEATLHGSVEGIGDD
jgi:hypothetical protein